MQEKKILIQMRDLRVGSGIASCIMKYYEYTVEQGYTIDFLLNRNIDSPFVDTVKKHNSKIYLLPHDTGKPNVSNYRYIKTVLSKGYDILHVNISGLNAVMSLHAAKSMGMSRRIYHTHAPRETSSMKARMRSLLYDTACVADANEYVACSESAGKSVFGNKPFAIITNAMNTSQYHFDPDARMQLRKSLEIENKFVVGVVGRMSEPKNPAFIISVFSEMAKLNPAAMMIWAGDGELKPLVLNTIKKNKIEDKVVLLGSRNDVNKLYSAMDVLLMPSKFEGLGLVFVEAQIAGLPCFSSTNVPKDVNISPNMNYISLNESPKVWAQRICETPHFQRDEFKDCATKAGFEIATKKNSLVELYDGVLQTK